MDEKPAHSDLQAVGAHSLIRMDGTPFYVETRILRKASKEEEPLMEDYDGKKYLVCPRCLGIGKGCESCDGHGEVFPGTVWKCDTGLEEDDRWWNKDVPLKYCGNDVWHAFFEDIASFLVRPKRRLKEV